MTIRIKPHAKHKLLSNKGQKDKYNSNNIIYNINRKHIAYRDNSYYITIPYIDKIVLCGNPPNTSSEEISELIKSLRQDCEDKKEGSYPNSPLEYLHFEKQEERNFWRKYYTDTFKITPPDSNEFISLFIGNTHKNPGQRTLRLEFNPWKLGRENVEYFIRWYNDTFIHTSFYDIISVEKCINRLDITVDIVGIHISDLIFYLEETEEDSSRWYSGQGMLETYYFDAKPGGQSKIKAYDKMAECKAKDYKDHPYGENTPVTRVEIIINKPIFSVTELHKLHNKFKRIKIYNVKKLTPFLESCIPEERHNFDLFLDSVRHRGRRDALLRLPSHLKARYVTLLSHGTENLFAGYNDREQWKRHWTTSIHQSGLLAGR